MAGPASPYSVAWRPYRPCWKRTNVVTAAVVALLCSFSYLLGILQHGGGSTSVNPAVMTPISCDHNADLGGGRVGGAGRLDFEAHHTADESAAVLPVPWRFPVCDAKYSDYTPCEDRDRSLRFDRDRLIYRERHCPEKGEVLKCLIPAPPGYKNPFPWPASRDIAWFSNVPHKELAAGKAGQDWIRFDDDKFRFPGADAYIDDIDRLILLRDSSIRTALDIGCGVATFGAYLLSRNILTMSFAPRDTHEAQVQFTLERGVPAMIGVLATKRLPYPSRAFDVAHCSWCLIPWHLHDGQYLMEIDRILRPGGYWVLSGPPINWKNHWKGWERTKEDLNAEQTAIETVAVSLCWKKVKEQGDVAIWQKPINHIDCKAKHKTIRLPKFCQAQNPDAAWYTQMETCITLLPDVSTIQDIAGGELKRWPERLMAVPPRVLSGSLDEVTPEIFLRDSKLWQNRVGHYKAMIGQLGQKVRYRNVLDMNAKFGGFAAALIDDPVWVMNIVPTAANISTLGVIYERGLIGTYHDWCEALSTYPRTYDLLHADSVFSLYKDRCEMEEILLEMDRVLRPEGTVILRDDVDILVKIKMIIDGMRWESKIMNHEDGPHVRDKLLLAMKTYWTASD